MDETGTTALMAAFASRGRLTQTPSAGLRTTGQVGLYQTAKTRLSGAVGVILDKLAFPEGFHCSPNSSSDE